MLPFCLTECLTECFRAGYFRVLMLMQTIIHVIP